MNKRSTISFLLIALLLLAGLTWAAGEVRSLQAQAQARTGNLLARAG